MVDILEQATATWWAAIITSIGSVIVIWARLKMNRRIKKGYKWVRKRTFGRAHQKILEQHDIFAAQLNGMESRQNEIWAELKPNGRGSIQDQLAEIHDEVIETADLLDAKVQADHMPNFRTDEHGLVTFVNRKYRQVTGYDKEQLLGDGWIIVVQQDQRDKYQDLWHRVVKEKREITVTLPCVRPDGVKHSMDIEVHKVVNRKTGHLRGYYGVVVNHA